jgi:hypothetical protein
MSCPRIGSKSPRFNRLGDLPFFAALGLGLLLTLLARLARAAARIDFLPLPADIKLSLYPLDREQGPLVQKPASTARF